MFSLKLRPRSSQRESAHLQTTEPLNGPSSRPQISARKKLMKRCLDSLRFEQIDARQMTIRTAHDKTCRWLLDSQQYLDWLDITKLVEHHGFLWIKGKAGTGKSTLMKFALNAYKRTENDIVLSFFFNARGQDLEKSIVGTYRALLLQLVECRPKLKSIFNRLSASMFNHSVERGWSKETLKELLEAAIQKLQHTSVVWFIDALDECAEDQVRDMIQFFEHIGDLAVSNGICFRVCLSSRHYPNITIRRGIRLVLEESKGHSQDITNYVETELKIGKSRNAQQVRAELQEKASNIFMWVVLVVGILNKESDHGRPHTFRQKLRDIPSDLNELFRDILTRDSDDKDRLVLSIQWVLFAKWPLSPLEFYHAIRVGTDSAIITKTGIEDVTDDVAKLFVLSSSKGLAEVTKSSFGPPRVQFIHESVRDFLLTRSSLGKIWPEFGTNFEGQSHNQLAQCCLNYVSSCANVSPFRTKLPMKVSRQFPLLQYATQNIFSHANTAEGEGVSQIAFINSFPCDQWVKLDNLFEPERFHERASDASLLYLLAEKDMTNLVNVHGSVDCCTDLVAGRYGCALFAAAALGNEGPLQVFLRSLEVSLACDPAFFSIDDCVLYGTTKNTGKHDFFYARSHDFLLNAAELGNDKVLAVLIASGKFRLDVTDSRERTVLWWASRNDCVMSVRLLLAADPTLVDVQNSHKKPLLTTVAEQGSLRVLHLLLERDNKVDADTLRAAFIQEQEKALELLLGKGIVELHATHHPYFLYQASRLGYKEVAKWLLDKCANADIDLKSEIHGMALQAAANSGHACIVELLLDAGIDVNVQGGYYGNALQAAILFHRSSLVIIRLLLEKGADINAKSGEYGTPLQAASFMGRIDIVTILLEAGADINADGGFYGSALQAASYYGDSGLVQMLLDQGADVNAKGGEYGSALQAAQVRGHKDIVCILEETIRKSSSNTPQAELSNRPTETAPHFVDSGVDMNVQGQGTSPTSGNSSAGMMHIGKISN